MIHERIFLSLWEEWLKEDLLGNQTKSKKRRENQSTRLKKSFVEKLSWELSQETGETPEAFHFDNFELRDEKL